MSARLRVGLAGLGFGMAHLSALSELSDRFDVVAVCDPSPAKLDVAHSYFGVPNRHETFEELVERADIDVVDICTPPALHAPMARRALEGAKHVICEKPLAPSIAEVDRLDALARTTDRVLMPIFQYRFGNGVARLRRLISAGAAGRPFVATVETGWRRGSEYYATPWRGHWDTELGGVCAMHAIHSHDLLVHLLGPIASVSARTATRVNPVETEDCAVVAVELRSGALATLAATLGSAREYSRIRIHFEHLSAESGSSPYETGAEPWTIEAATPAAARRIDEVLAGFEPERELLAGQLLAFHDALGAGSDPPVTVADARAAVELLTAIYHSAETGTRVELPIGPDHPRYEGWGTNDRPRR